MPFLVLIVLFFTPFAAQAQEADVAVEVTSVAEGRPFWIAIEITPGEGRFVSWIDHETGGPGVTFRLDEAEGFSKGALVLPPPGPTGVEGDYGYSGPVTILQEILVARDVPFSRDYDFTGEVVWHECDEDGCKDNRIAYAFSLPFGPGEANATATVLFGRLRADAPGLFPWPVEYRGEEQAFSLILYTGENGPGYEAVSILPAWGLQGRYLNETLTLEKTNEGYFIEAAPPDGFMPRKKFEGILYVKDNGGGTTAYSIATRNSFEDETKLSLNDPDLAGYTIWLALGFAFLGGLILNLMPCVFPVLTLKVFTLVKAGGLSPKGMRLDGVAYTGGILFSFLIVALLLLTFRSLGNQVGWGFQLQSPYFVISMAIILFLVALVFLGLINIRLPFAIEGKSKGEGALGSFYTGMLATLLATPCTAPFMAPALGFALTLETMAAIAVFLGLGLGLAAPYLLVSFIPKVQAIFPKPGPWMDTFKKILAIPILLTVGWLGWVLYTQIGDERTPVAESVVEWSAEEVWSLRLQGKGVLVNYTATWCLSCIVNERLVFSNEKFQRFLADNNIVYMEADWTSPDPAIAASLEVLGRSGLPVYAYYPPGGPTRDVVLLPEILTLEVAIERISTELE